MCVGMAFAATGQYVAAATAVIDLDDRQQTIRGFGGATVFQPPGLPASLTNEEMDTLFGTGPGQIGFTLLRIRVAEDADWRAIELAHAQGARARGAEVIATPWSPPAAMKTNNSLIDGSLKPSSYADYAAYLEEFARYMAANGAPLYAISIQNEPDIDVTYESCDWTPAEMLEFCRDHANTITATRVIAPESFQFRREMSDPILNDATAAAHVDIIGGHIYGGGLARYLLAEQRGKEVWMTEHLELTTDWAGALATAREIHDCLAVANFNAYIWWYARRYYGPLGEDGVTTKRGHVMAQFSRFIRPGYVRVTASENPTTGVHVSAYRGESVVIVAVNEGASTASQTFSIPGASFAAVTPWVTSASLNMAMQPAVPVTSGTFTVVLPPQSVTTLVGDLAIAPPAITHQPYGYTVETGSTAVLRVEAGGEFVSYQWNRDGEVLPGETSAVLTRDAVQAADAGAYTVVVTNPGGSVTTEAAVLAVASTGNAGRLVNLSTRSPVGVGDAVQIGGFVVEGDAGLPVLVRAAGPALAAAAGLPGTLADPMFALHAQATSTVVAENDDWDATLAPLFTRCGAFAWTAGSKDAALARTLAAGAYTAVVRSATDTPGMALVEIYLAPDAPAENRLVNLSSRTFVGTGDDVQIAGFVIAGSTAQTVLVRASGPALHLVAGLHNTLGDPVIDLFRQSGGTVRASVDDWDASAGEYFANVGAFPWRPGSRDAALLITLEPGAYTAIVRDKSGGSGLALVEVYAVP